MLVATCPTCGQRYEARLELAGREMRCPACGGVMTVPHHPPSNIGEPSEASSNPNGTGLAGGVEASVERDLAAFNERTQSAAARPGMLRVRYLRYIGLFPKWPSIFCFWIVLMLLMSWVMHWLFLLLAVPAFAALWIHHRQIAAQFIGGCINPGMIVSLDPPLVAVSTNLDNGGADCPVIKILAHPIGRMGNIEQKIGACFPAVAVYQGVRLEWHWQDFFPIAANCATSNLQQLNRMMTTLAESEWLELEFGLSQIPTPYEPGLYRTFLTTKWGGHVDVAQAVFNMLPHLPSHGQYVAAQGIPHQVIQRVLGGYGVGVDSTQILAVIGGSQSGEVGVQDSRGVIVIPQGLIYNLQGVPPGRIAWSEIRGAFYGVGGLEIIRTSFERVWIPESAFPQSNACWSIEVLVNAICDGFSSP